MNQISLFNKEENAKLQTIINFFFIINLLQIYYNNIKTLTKYCLHLKSSKIMLLTLKIDIYNCSFNV